MVRASLLLVVVTAGAALGCGGDGAAPDGPSGPDAGAIDAATGAGGLTFVLVAQPALEQVATAVAVNELKVWLRDVRAIGDAAPGDSRTSLTDLTLDYRSDRDPAALAFPLAPPGVYSELDAHLGQGGDGYEIRGTVTVAGHDYELEIRDETATGTISIPLGALRVDTATSVTVTVDLGFLGDIDWSSVLHEGRIELESQNPITQQVRAGLLTAFSLAP